MFVFPVTPATRPTSYIAPHLYEYQSSHGDHPLYDAARFTTSTPSHPSHFGLFPQPSPEELEEREYRRALEVVVNHRRRQAEKEAAIRRQQLAEAARQHYFALAAELEQQRQGELLAARRAEWIRSQRARARLAAAERQPDLNALLRILGEPKPLARQAHVAKRKPLVDVLEQRLLAESDAEITESIKNILSSLRPRPVQPEKVNETGNASERSTSAPQPNRGVSEPSKGVSEPSKGVSKPSEGASEPSEDASKSGEDTYKPGEDASKFIEDLLSSIFPGLIFHSPPSRASSANQTRRSVLAEMKGKARGLDVEVPQGPVQVSKAADEASGNIIRPVPEPRKRTLAPRSSDQAGPSGSSTSTTSSSQPVVNEEHQAQIDRVVALSSVENLQNALTKLQADFILPTELDHYTQPVDDLDETVSVSSATSSDLTRLIPYTAANKPVYKYENQLSGLLDELDKIESHGDAEVREKRKGVVKAVEKALEDVEHAVGEAVEKRLSFISTSASDEPLQDHDDGDFAEGVLPSQTQVNTPVVTDRSRGPDSSACVEETIATPVEEAGSESYALVSVETPTNPTHPEVDVEASAAAIAPAPIEPQPTAETEPIGPQADALENADTFLLPENPSPPSPVLRRRNIDGDSDDDGEVLSVDSEAEGSDWSEIDH